VREARHWSFAGRMMRLYLLGTALLLGAVGTTSFWLLARTTESQLDALTTSQIKEFRLDYERRLRAQQESVAAAEASATQTPPTPTPLATEVEEIAVALRGRGGPPAAWRVWNLDNGDIVVEFDQGELLDERSPAIEPAGQTARLDRGRRWRTEPLAQGLALGVVVDGSGPIGELRHYQALAGALMLVVAMVSLALGAYMIQRMTSLLRRVAESARAVHEPTSEPVELELTDAPDEIRDVVDALRDLFRRVRAEADRSRVFYASMAHELRSPIQNLVGETEVALFEERAGPDYRRVLESNLEELRDLGDAIDNLIAICSERRPGAGAELEDFDLLEEARIRLARERTQALRRQVELDIAGEGDLGMRGDRESLLRALRNLAANAIQWSPAGARVEVRLADRGEEVEVAVDDAGPGVPDELKERIFEPFARGPALDGHRIGYGLGLAIVRAAVDAQGGEVEVGRSPLGGARFRMALPRRARPRAPVLRAS
jgi:two-component system heavy metal sensor histidine kinase CusS